MAREIEKALRRVGRRVSEFVRISVFLLRSFPISIDISKNTNESTSSKDYILLIREIERAFWHRSFKEFELWFFSPILIDVSKNTNESTSSKDYILLIREIERAFWHRSFKELWFLYFSPILIDILKNTNESTSSKDYILLIREIERAFWHRSFKELWFLYFSPFWSKNKDEFTLGKVTSIRLYN